MCPAGCAKQPVYHFRKRNRERTRTPSDLIASAWCLKQPLEEKQDCDLPLCSSTKRATSTTVSVDTTASALKTTNIATAKSTNIAMDAAFSQTTVEIQK